MSSLIPPDSVIGASRSARLLNRHTVGMHRGEERGRLQRGISGVAKFLGLIGNYNAGGVSLGQDAYDFIEWVAAQPWCDGNVGMVGIAYSGWAFTDGVKSRMLEKHSPEELKTLVAMRLEDPDVASWPNLVHVLNYPKNHEAWFDIVMNELDGDWYEERSPITLAPNIDIPVYLRIDQGRGWTMDGTVELFNELGIENGVMDEPAVSVFVEGAREQVTGGAWPPKDVEYKPLYLRPRGKLSLDPEPMDAQYAAPDGFYKAPLTVTDKVEILSWSTDTFEEPTELIGSGAAHIFAEIDQPDTNFILRLWDYAPNGKRQLITSSYLKASHRELDDERSTEGSPVHPHTRSVPVEPGQIEEYVLRLYPFANTFRPGHRLTVELSNAEPLADEHNALLPPDAFHLPVGRPVTHKIYRDAAHHSRLVLPFTKRPAAD